MEAAFRMVLNKEETEALADTRTRLERSSLQLSEDAEDLQKAASGLAALAESCKKLASPATGSGNRNENAVVFEEKVLSIKRKRATIEHELKTEESRQKITTKQIFFPSQPPFIKIVLLWDELHKLTGFN